MPHSAVRMEKPVGCMTMNTYYKKQGAENYFHRSADHIDAITDNLQVDVVVRIHLKELRIVWSVEL